MTPSTHTIREARLGDEEALGTLHVRAWQAGYRRMMPDAFLDGLRVESRAARWKKVLASGFGDGKRLFVQLEDRTLVGMAGIGPDRWKLGCGELYMINVDPDAWGRGFGRALLAHAQGALRELGHARAILWVVSRNDRARRFYERAGWTFSGLDEEHEISEDGSVFMCNEARYEIVLTQ